MSAIRPLTFLALLALQALPGGAHAADDAADVVLRGGVVHTLDPARPHASALAIRGGRIVAVGGAADVAALAGPATRVVELDGATVLPGLHDSHVHPMSGGVWLARCRLDGAATARALLRGARDCARRGGGDWLLARGWPDDAFPEGTTVDGLERVAPERLVALVSAAGDRIWVGARARERIGLAAGDEGVERDARGAPTGFVHGAAAQRARGAWPRPAESDFRAALRAVTARLNARGVTSLTDASVGPELRAAYVAAEAAGELTVRVRLALRHDPSAALAPPVASPRLRIDAVKLFVDGDLPERGAALLAPYAGDANERGTLVLEPAALDRTVAAIDATGYDLHLHALGDRAVRVALDALGRAATANGPRDRRHQVAHLELVDAADVPRFAALRAIANLQLAWPADDALARERLGPERAARALPFRSLAASGARIVAGSDGPMPELDPFRAMEIAATRLPRGERLTVERALAAYTRDAAYAQRTEGSTGTLAPGFAADLVVVDRDILAIAPKDVGETRVLLTLLDGRVVFEAAR